MAVPYHVNFFLYNLTLFFQNIIKYFILLLLVFTREYFMDASKISFYVPGLFYDYLDLTWINLKVMK